MKGDREVIMLGKAVEALERSPSAERMARVDLALGEAIEALERAEDRSIMQRAGLILELLDISKRFDIYRHQLRSVS